MHKAVKEVARTIDHNRQFELLARLGYVMNGLLHALIGIAAIDVALGRGGEVDQSGAIGPLAHMKLGAILITPIAIGLTALGIWQFIHVILIRNKKDERQWPQRLSGSAKGIVYLTLGLTTATFLFKNTPSSSSIYSSEKIAARILSLPAGEQVLFLIGILIACVGAGFIYRGVTRHFLDKIDVPRGIPGRVLTILGIIGYISKGVTFVSLGILIANAALTLDIGKASGLDGALKSYLALPFGPLLLIATGLGFICYAFYSTARSHLTVE